MKQLPIAHILLLLMVWGGGICTSYSQNVEVQAQSFLDDGKKAEAAQLFSKAGFSYLDQNEYQHAIDAFTKALTLNEELGNNTAIVAVSSSLGAAYSSLEQYEHAINALDKALSITKVLGNKPKLAEAYFNLGMTSQNAGKHEQAVLNLEAARELFQEIQNHKMLGKVYIGLYTSYDVLGNSAKAGECFSLYSSIDKKLKQEEIANIQQGAEIKVEEAVTAKKHTEQILNETKEVLAQTEDTLKKSQKLTIEQQLSIKLNESKLRETENLLNIEQLRRSRYTIAFAGISLVLVIIIFFGLRLRSANVKINRQNETLEIQNENIRSSLDYAQMIQNILLPSKDELSLYYENLVLFRPKDIVSGDFYWFSHIQDPLDGTCCDCLALADCTGHGVPGALMSMIGHRLLSEIVNEKKQLIPSEILEMLDTGIRTTLKQDETNNRDGMEIAVITIGKNLEGIYELSYSGAKRPLYIIRKSTGELEEIAPDRRSIGGKKSAKKKSDFTTKKVLLGQGDQLYITSDGIIDQNNENRVKYGSVKLKEKLSEISILPMQRQEIELNKTLVDHMGRAEQRDDICLIGLKV